MAGLSGLITYDKEFSASVDCLLNQHRSSEPLPVAINGLTDGASCAYLAEAIKLTAVAKGNPALILVGNDGQRDKLTARLSELGIRSAAYKSRDLILHNISFWYQQ